MREREREGEGEGGGKEGGGGGGRWGMEVNSVTVNMYSVYMNTSMCVRERWCGVEHLHNQDTPISVQLFQGSTTFAGNL